MRVVVGLPMYEVACSVSTGRKPSLTLTSITHSSLSYKCVVLLSHEIPAFQTRMNSTIA